jgi:hypothetical protein
VPVDATCLSHIEFFILSVPYPFKHISMTMNRQNISTK